MKKVIISLLSGSFIMSSAYAGIGTGFYAGGSLGHTATTAKLKGQLTHVNGIAHPVNGAEQIGARAPSAHIVAGYGAVCNNFYTGAEVGYSFIKNKIKSTLGQNDVQNKDTLQLTRNGHVNFALRGGYIVLPDTMVYVRLGLNYSTWKMNDSLSGIFNINHPAKKSQRMISFEPGFGLETAISDSLLTRIEYLYEIGGSVTAKHNSQNPLFRHTHSKAQSIHTQSGKVGLVYKF